MRLSILKKIFQVATLSFALFSIATTVLAAVDDYTVLSPLPGVTAPCSTDTAGKTACKTNLQIYLPGLIKWSMGVAAVMAFAMISFGGITYMTSDSVFKTEKGKEYVTNAIYGLLLVISAWIILNTINPNILNFDFVVHPITIKPGAPGAGGVVRAGYTLSNDEVQQNTDLVKALGQAGVNVNAGPCSHGETSGCTNIVGLPVSAINGLTHIAFQCKESLGNSCNITITGGTEGGHAAHGNGIPVVDLSPTTSLNRFLSKTNSKAANPTSGTTVITAEATYVYEETGDNGRATGPHWHVTFN